MIEGLANEFPALRTLENRPTNLPVQPTPLIGRERESPRSPSGSARRRASAHPHRPGGTGKTRLALQAAADLVEDFPQGVFFVALAPLADRRSSSRRSRRRSGSARAGARRRRREPRGFLAEKRLLLVLDNFEHLLDAAPGSATCSPARRS